jgi:hypothetical protein
MGRTVGVKRRGLQEHRVRRSNLVWRRRGERSGESSTANGDRVATASDEAPAWAAGGWVRKRWRSITGEVARLQVPEGVEAGQFERGAVFLAEEAVVAAAVRVG